MYIEQLYTNCLAEAAYYIESNGEAAIIDPIRETEPYMEMAMKRGSKIKYVFETHFHADFVSGHIDLAKKTGAQIIFGPKAETGYKVHNAKDGETFKVGEVTIKTLHTPGHTPESTCYLLIDKDGKEHAIFTGDTLFVGDVGRPDLLDGKMTKEDLAGMLYESLNKKIKTLPDNVIVYPAHGPGSSCGKKIGKETWSTVGEQKQKNYALQSMDKKEFIAVVTNGLTPPPQYFFKDAMINKNGYDGIDLVMKRNVIALSAEKFSKEISNGAIILDTRNPDNFEKGFIKSSVNIGLNGTYAVWVGTLIDINKPLVIVAEEGKEEESILRLARVGYENVKGFLKGGINEWTAGKKLVETIKSITPDKFAETKNKQTDIHVLDVRRPHEFDNGHIEDAISIPLSDLSNSTNRLDKKETYYVHCERGYRSMIASSILKAKGFDNLINVYEGYSKIKDTDIPIAVPSI